MNCSVWGCDNYRKKTREITFFNLPKDKKIADAWIARLRRVDIPKNVIVCEEHFEDECFDKSVDIKNRLMAGWYFITNFTFLNMALNLHPSQRIMSWERDWTLLIIITSMITI